MNITCREVGGLLVFDMAGDFDSRSAGPAKEEMRTAIHGGALNIVVNLKDVGYIDSAGLGALVSALKTAKENDGTVALAEPTSQVNMVIELTKLHLVFEIYSCVEDAVSGISAKPPVES
ncbi:MAG TPA: STAS domain-containing protein [bacterium]|jgi:anti-sigma B factor antagonist